MLLTFSPAHEAALGAPRLLEGVVTGLGAPKCSAAARDVILTVIEALLDHGSPVTERVLAPHAVSLAASLRTVIQLAASEAKLKRPKVGFSSTLNLFSAGHMHRADNTFLQLCMSPSAGTFTLLVCACAASCGDVPIGQCCCAVDSAEMNGSMQDAFCQSAWFVIMQHMCCQMSEYVICDYVKFWMQ